MPDWVFIGIEKASTNTGILIYEVHIQNVLFKIFSSNFFVLKTLINIFGSFQICIEIFLTKFFLLSVFVAWIYLGLGSSIAIQEPADLKKVDSKNDCLLIKKFETETTIKQIGHWRNGCEEDRYVTGIIFFL